jgi:uncharacterized protein (TIGR00299 family) protein
MKTAYIQSIGGASGDMLLGALLDLGLSLDALRQELDKLDIGGYELVSAADIRCEIRGTKLTVVPSDNGHLSSLSPRSQLDIVASAPLTEWVRTQATRILNILWQAESRVHGEAPEALELEELGTVDTLVDVVGFVIGLHLLGITEVYAAPLVLGEATPPRRPGGYSNPAPATLELVAMAGAPVSAELPIHQGIGELTTPTGAAIITGMASFERPAMSVIGVGVGLGGKDPELFPNVVRIWLGERAENAALNTPAALRQASIVLLETNLDDVSGLTLGYTQERLFAIGALDVWTTPIQMKKNRPGAVLSVLVPKDKEREASEVILRETPTLGIRTRSVDRYVAGRKMVSIQTDFGPINVKVKLMDGKAVGAAPEPDEVRQIALDSGRPFQEVYQRTTEEARRQLL